MRLENAVKSLAYIEKSAEIDLHPELKSELVDESTVWTGWGYAGRKPRDEATCET